MSVWRRKALELFPEQRRWIEDREQTFSIYQLFFDLLPIALDAHKNQDKQTLCKLDYESGSTIQSSILRRFVLKLIPIRVIGFPSPR